MEDARTNPARQPASTPRWSFPARFAFRFAFAFYVLWCFPVPFGDPSDWVSAIAPKPLIPWVASQVLHVAIPQIANPEGGGVYGTARTLLLLAAAFGAALLWSAVDRKRTQYETLHAWLRLYLRVVLGALMLDYGSAKVCFPDQMRPPTLSTLLVPFGDLAPIARLWLFMGSSQFYTFCTGAVEMTAGALLFIPGLTTVGALISAIALTNVFLLDVSYDVLPMQIAFFMLSMAVFLLAPDLGRFRDAFILRRDVPARPATPLFTARSLENAAALLTLLAGCYLMGTDVIAERRFSKAASTKHLNAPYYGAWAVDTFTVDGIERPPLFTDAGRWRLIVFDWGVWYPKPIMVIHFGTGTRRLFTVDFDADRKALVLLQPKPVGNFVVNDQARDTLILEGDFEGQRVRAVLHRTVPDPTAHQWPWRFFRDEIRWGDNVII